MIKIISGKYKNSIIPTLPKATYRPSTGMFREAIFSILTSGKFWHEQVLENAKVLDVFAGTGSFGFESLSRGAQEACFIDINQNYLNAAKEFAYKIGALSNTRFLCINALHMPKSNNQYDIIFIDPPYGKNLALPTLHSLLAGKWLTKDALVVIELYRKDKMDAIIPNLCLTVERIYGDSKLLIFNYNAM